jgi:hypothetical protein
MKLAIFAIWCGSQMKLRNFPAEGLGLLILMLKV